MSTIVEQALAEALRLEPPGDYVGGYGVDADEYWVLGHVAAILATEPMQAIARIVDAAVEWCDTTERWTSPYDNEACQRAAWDLKAAWRALGEDR